MKTVVDSSGWIELFVAGPLADRFAPYVHEPRYLVTPTIVLYEVYKKVKRERGEDLALTVAASLRATTLVLLTEALAIASADVSLRYGLAMADAIVYATALQEDARLVTGDADMKELPGVIYVR